MSDNSKLEELILHYREKRQEYLNEVEDMNDRFHEESIIPLRNAIEERLLPILEDWHVEYRHAGIGNDGTLYPYSLRFFFETDKGELRSREHHNGLLRALHRELDEALSLRAHDEGTLAGRITIFRLAPPKREELVWVTSDNELISPGGEYIGGKIYFGMVSRSLGERILREGMEPGKYLPSYRSRIDEKGQVVIPPPS